MKRLITALIIGLGLSPVFVMPVLAAGTAQQDIFSICQKSASNPNPPNSPVCKDKNTNTNPINRYLHIAAMILAVLTGIAAVILILISGLNLVTSEGNPEHVKQARQRLIYAVVGLIFVASAYVFATYLIDRVL